MSTATIETTPDLKRQRALELLTLHPDRSIREIAREVGMPESTLRVVKSQHDAEKLQLVTLRLTDVRTDGGTQTRAAMNDPVISDYAEAYIAGKVLPPPVVYLDPNGLYWLADGFHRLEAATRAQVTELACEVRLGTQREALKFSLQANAHHGLHRSNEDKRTAVAIALNDPEWSKLSDAAIAEMACVSSPLVARVREELAATINSYGQTERVAKNGRVIDTANLGRRPKRGGTKPEDEDEDGDRPAREPGSDDDKDEPVIFVSNGDPKPSEEQVYAESLPLYSKLSERCREIYVRDALAHRAAQKWLEEGKRLGLAKTRTGEMQGAWQFLASRFLREPFPSAWLRCAADGCTDGLTATGEHCSKCRGRGYRVS